MSHLRASEGVEVVVDVVLNHMARPCPEAQHKAHGMPCAPRNSSMEMP